jgi:hypothetical protein
VGTKIYCLGWKKTSTADDKILKIKKIALKTKKPEAFFIASGSAVCASSLMFFVASDARSLYRSV